VSARVFDARPCGLGEGPLWHPRRQELFWFDITGCRMYANGTGRGRGRDWRFDEMHSAAGWISHDALLLASETGLWHFDLETQARHRLCDLEADNPRTRSNDGRADPWGGFWIGTMGKSAQPRAGAIYRYWHGEIRLLFDRLTIPNAICFAPDGRFAHFCDTVTGQVMKVALDAEGWPAGEPGLFLDLRAAGLNPDGAVVDAAGTLWLAQWGAGRVAAYDGGGGFLRAIGFAAPHTSCPAFGGPTLETLYCTSALEGMSAQDRAAFPRAGMTFAAPAMARGQAEHRVII
jgi:sugar lactone lactonase YvrE